MVRMPLRGLGWGENGAFGERALPIKGVDDGAAKWGLTGWMGWGSLKALSKAAVVAEDDGHFSFAAFAKMKLIG